MNAKKKLVVVVMVLMMMVTAVAYAAWSDTIDINGTAQTGSFDVQWSNIKTSAPQNKEGKFEVNLAKDSAGGDNDQINIEITNAKPEEVYEVAFDAVNKGSLEAVISAVNGSNGVSDFDKKPNDELSFATNYFRVDFLDANNKALTKNDIASLAPMGQPNNSQSFKIKVTVLGDSTNGDTAKEKITFEYAFTYSQLVEEKSET